MLKEKILKEFYKNYQEVFKKEEVVVGDGKVDSKIILIGEAPGKDEVKLKKPFVGVAGKNLAQFIEVLGLVREELFITNVIKYRLGKISPKSGRIVNRPANKKDINLNKDYLLDEISIIKPEIIVTLGNVPLTTICEGKEFRIGNVHGELLDIKISNVPYKMFPLYHPASIIYNASLKDVYNEDLMKLKVCIDDIKG